MSLTREFFHTFNQAWADHDVEAIVKSVTDDFHFRMATDEQGIQGKEAFREWLNTMTDSNYKMTLATDKFLISGDQAVLSGSLAMQEPDGTQRKFMFCDLYTLRDDKISALLSFFMDPDKEAGCGPD